MATTATVRPIARSNMAAVFDLRTSVVENHLGPEELAARGITPEGVQHDLDAGDLGGWVAEEGGCVVAFSMADRRDGQIFALFTLPGHEGRGHGTRLLAAATGWLRDRGFAEAWLTTDPGTRAERFYASRGWTRHGLAPNGEALFRLTLRNG